MSPTKDGHTFLHNWLECWSTSTRGNRMQCNSGCGHRSAMRDTQHFRWSPPRVPALLPKLLLSTGHPAELALTSQSRALPAVLDPSDRAAAARLRSEAPWLERLMADQWVHRGGFRSLEGTAVAQFESRTSESQFQEREFNRPCVPGLIQDQNVSRFRMYST